ncbi:hypothetical protein [Acidipropionibacterium acidipropionici]|uniref:hypothetical protein n=1 Tax=Acidipropionibacterium acidipropionici TaxID=1748 RepID=UPI00110B075A|nr:hypothetical protein [Acidipropionibacterium acidipropionici]QCV95644.1 hypothetical protein FEZ30_10615 [Acidipropionibacterium acidipropionici]
MSLIQGCLSRTATMAEIQIARAEQAPGWEAADADLASARAEHLPADEMRAAQDPALVDPERVAERAVLAAVAYMRDQAQLGHDITGALACVMERQEHLVGLQAQRRHPAFRSQS